MCGCGAEKRDGGGDFLFLSRIVYDSIDPPTDLICYSSSYMAAVPFFDVKAFLSLFRISPFRHCSQKKKKKKKGGIQTVWRRPLHFSSVGYDVVNVDGWSLAHQTRGSSSTLGLQQLDGFSFFFVSTEWNVFGPTHFPLECHSLIAKNTRAPNDFNR